MKNLSYPQESSASLLAKSIVVDYACKANFSTRSNDSILVKKVDKRGSVSNNERDLSDRNTR